MYLTQLSRSLPKLPDAVLQQATVRERLVRIVCPEERRRIVTPIMVTIRYAGDPDELFAKWERAVELWKEEFGGRFVARTQSSRRAKAVPSWSS